MTRLRITPIDESIVNKIPQSLDIIVTLTVALLVTGIVTYLVFMPIGGFIALNLYRYGMDAVHQV